MLQPRLAPLKKQLCTGCFHSLAIRSYPASEAYARPKRGAAVNEQLQVESSALEESLNRKAVTLRTYKPRTPGLRHLKRPINDHLYKGRPYGPLTFARRGQHIGGRNRDGHITVRHRGNGAKRRIRTIDFNRKAPGQHLVERIEYDPGRSAHIALLSIKDDNGKINYSYVVASEGLRAGEKIESFREGIPQRLLDELGSTADAGLLATKTCHPGNCLPLNMVPPGTAVFNIAMKKNGPAQLCRSAGAYGTVIGKNEGDAKWADFVDVKLKSGEILHIQKDCCCTVGIASNVDYNHRQLGKAGRSRWLGIRPTVRGVAMNASDHPHGGGRGKSKGNRNPVSPWGILTKGGYKTRKKSKVNRLLVKARPRSEAKKAKKAKKLKRNK